jgi:proprotein convertase subtilisin/kexin type 5
MFPNCVTCTSTPSLSCQTCPTAYFVNTSGGCSPCVGNCTSCQNSSSCTTCMNSGYFYKSSLNKCLLCTDIFPTCVTCTSTPSLSCQTCPAANFVNISGGCSPCVGNCTSCQNSSSCTTCSASNYFYKSTLNKCLLCSDIFPICITCTSTPSLSCQTCPIAFFVNTVGGCSACVGNCTSCQNSSSCTTCLASNYFYWNKTNSCKMC